MLRVSTGRCLALLSLLLLPIPFAFAETVELVTYYPVAATGDFHTQSLTVGNGYTNVTPNAGEAFIEGLLSVGSVNPVNIGGGWGAPQVTKLWLQDNTAGAFPALVIAGTPGAGGSGGGAVQFVDATTNAAVGDFGFSGVAAAASEVGIAARRNNTAISFYTTPAVLPVLRMVIQPSGSIGIGTPTPAGLLHLVGNNDATSNVLFMPGNDTAAAGTPDLRVGIGTAAPLRSLHVVSDFPNGPALGQLWLGQIVVEPPAGAAIPAAGISLKTDYGTGRVWTLLAGSGGPSTNFRIFDATAGLDRMDIDPNGYVGIGTSNPGVPLDIATTGAYGLRVNSLSSDGSQLMINGPSNHAAWIGTNQGGNAAYIRLTRDNTNANRTWELTAGDSPSYNFSITHPGTTPAFYIDTAGNSYGRFFPISDGRLKKNVAPLSGVLEKLGRIRGVSYDWAGKEHVPAYVEGQRQIGVIAQELEKVYPELVVSDGTTKAVDYMHLTAVLLEAVKELEARNSRLEKEVTRLKEDRQNRSGP